MIPSKRLMYRRMLKKKSYGANVSQGGGYPAFEPPYIENFESDTIGETGTELMAKPTHHVLWPTTNEAEAIDYLTFKPCSEAYTHCFGGLSNSTGTVMLLPDGVGWTPSGGTVMLLECVVNSSGIGAGLDLYMMDKNFEDGILFGWVANQNSFLDTRTGGVGTRKLNSSLPMTSTPFATIDWFYFGVQYDQGTNNVYARCKVLGLTNTEDTGWVYQGKVSNPTYSQSKEWVDFRVSAKAQGSTGRKGYAQVRVCDQEVHGYGLGALETHNYLIT